MGRRGGSWETREVARAAGAPGHENAGQEWWAGGKDDDEAVKKWSQFLKVFHN